MADTNQHRRKPKTGKHWAYAMDNPVTVRGLLWREANPEEERARHRRGVNA